MGNVSAGGACNLQGVAADTRTMKQTHINQTQSTPNKYLKGEALAAAAEAAARHQRHLPFAAICISTWISPFPPQHPRHSKVFLLNFFSGPKSITHRQSQNDP